MSRRNRRPGSLVHIPIELQEHTRTQINEINSSENQRQSTAIRLIAPEPLHAEGGNLFRGFIIHGPPGTGKTRTILLGSLQYLFDNPDRQIAIITNSNAAAGQFVLQFYNLCMDANIPLNQTIPLLIHFVRPPSDTVDPWEPPIRELRNYIDFTPYPDWQIERARLNSWKNARIIVSTTYSVPRYQHFDVFYRGQIIFDEASQISLSLFTLGYYSLFRVESVGIVGDPNQLPPIYAVDYLRTDVISYLIGRYGFLGRIPRNLFVYLNYQYRMNPVISGLINALSRARSEERLRNAEVTNTHFLDQIYDRHFTYQDRPLWNADLKTILDPNIPLVLINTSPLGDDLDRTTARGSKFNLQEAHIARILYRLFPYEYLGLENENIAVIAMYREQTRRIGNYSSTVDKYQGSQSEIVIVSMVRANPERSIGFASEFNRLYVTLSRAKCKLIIIINRETFENSGYPELYQVLFDYLNQDNPMLAQIEIDENLLNYLNNINLDELEDN